MMVIVIEEYTLHSAVSYMRANKSTVVTICIAGFGVLVFRRWLSGGWCYSEADMTDKTVIVTGATSGIGYETVRGLVKRGARVVMACRDIRKGMKMGAELGMELNLNESPVSCVTLDLASFESIRAFANEVLHSEPQIHVLVNNAGLMCGRRRTVDGHEIQFATNHLGHFLLTHLLLRRIQASAPSRIINVTSNVHKMGEIMWDDLNLKEDHNYTPFKAYCQSKLANLLFTKKLSTSLLGCGVTTYAVHPGFVRTNFTRSMSDYLSTPLVWIFHVISWFCAKTPEQGAQTSIYCAIAEELANKSGGYYLDCHEATPAPQALCPTDAERLWDESLQMTGLDRT